MRHEKVGDGERSGGDGLAPRTPAFQGLLHAFDPVDPKLAMPIAVAAGALMEHLQCPLPAARQFSTQ